MHVSPDDLLEGRGWLHEEKKATHCSDDTSTATDIREEVCQQTVHTRCAHRIASQHVGSFRRAQLVVITYMTMPTPMINLEDEADWQNSACSLRQRERQK